MTTATLRKLGGSTVVALPPSLLDLLNCRQGDAVEIKFVAGKIEITSLKRKKMSLQERLKLYEQALPLRTTQDLQEDEEWLNAKPVGKEVL